jgi:hypothetical protein
MKGDLADAYLIVNDIAAVRKSTVRNTTSLRSFETGYL